jgi:hypothetical protein
MKDLLRRFLQTNLRLVCLAVVTVVSFVVTDVLRDQIGAKVDDLNKIAAATDATLQRLSSAESQLNLARAVIMPQAPSSLLGSALYGEKLSEVMPFGILLQKADQAAEQFSRISEVYLNDQQTRADEVIALGMQVDRAAIGFQSEKPVEAVNAASNGLSGWFSGCAAIHFSNASESISADFRTVDGAQTEPANLKAQFLAVSEETERLSLAYQSLKKSLTEGHAEIRSGVSGDNALAQTTLQETDFNNRSVALFGRCVDLNSKRHARIVMDFLRGFRLKVLDQVRPLAQDQDLLRYLGYIIAMLGFIASNVKPLARPAIAHDEAKLAQGSDAKASAPPAAT